MRCPIQSFDHLTDTSVTSSVFLIQWQHKYFIRSQVQTNSAAVQILFTTGSPVCLSHKLFAPSKGSLPRSHLESCVGHGPLSLSLYVIGPQPGEWRQALFQSCKILLCMAFNKMSHPANQGFSRDTGGQNQSDPPKTAWLNGKTSSSADSLVGGPTTIAVWGTTQDCTQGCRENGFRIEGLRKNACLSEGLQERNTRFLMATFSFTSP